MGLAVAFQLKRNYRGDEGCFGTLHENRSPPFALTLERTFKPANEVIIPHGIHKCTKSQYYKGGYPTFEIHVEGHSRILFHKGNVEAHSMGCILVGEYFHEFNGRAGIANSKGGFNEFMLRAGTLDEFYLEVT